MTSPAERQNHRLVAVRCPHCARSDNNAEVLVVVDGPDVQFMQVRGEDARPGDVGGKCRTCGRMWCVRMVAPRTGPVGLSGAERA